MARADTVQRQSSRDGKRQELSVGEGGRGLVSRGGSCDSRAKASVCSHMQPEFRRSIYPTLLPRYLLILHDLGIVPRRHSRLGLEPEHLDHTKDLPTFFAC